MLTACGSRGVAMSDLLLPTDSIVQLDTLPSRSDYTVPAVSSDYAIAWTHGGQRYLYHLPTGRASYCLAKGEDIYDLITQCDTAAYFTFYTPSENYGYQQIIDVHGRRLLSGASRFSGLPGGKVRVQSGIEECTVDLTQTRPNTWTPAPAYPDRVTPVSVSGSVTMDVDTVFGYPAGTQNTLFLNLHYEEPNGTSAADYAMGTWMLGRVVEMVGLLDSMDYHPVIRTRDDYSRARESLRRHFLSANDSVAAWSSAPVGVGVSMSLRWCKNGFFTYYRDTQSYTGGAHGFYTEAYLTYDLSSGCPLTSQGLFRDGALPDVRRLLLDSLSAGRSQALGHPVTADELDRLYGPVVLADELPPSGGGVLARPALMPQGIVFSFQPYEMGSFAEGVIRAVLPYAAVKPYLRPEAARRLGL